MDIKRFVDSYIFKLHTKIKTHDLILKTDNINHMLFRY